MGNDPQEARKLPESLRPVRSQEGDPLPRAEDEGLLADPGIVRNRAKIEAAVANAKAFLAVQREFGTFDAYVWRFAGGQPMKNAWRSQKQIPPRTPESDAMSKDVRARGFCFVGCTICYAFMQAVGLVNDHTVDCFPHDQV